MRQCLIIFLASMVFLGRAVALEGMKLQEAMESYGGLTTQQMRQAAQHDSVWHARANLDERRTKNCAAIPPSVPHFTKVGFKKTRLPDEAWTLVQKYWKELKGTGGEEEWDSDNIYVNHYAVMPTVDHLSAQMKDEIGKYVKPMLEEWSGRDDLVHTSTYGIRTYFHNNVLRMHPDRHTVLVISAIVNVEQDLGEEGEANAWPLEIYDHEGTLHSITMQPGDIVFYESAACVHGRPQPFKGKSFSNFFTHYVPTSEEHWVSMVKEHRRKNGIDPNLTQ